jgi:hypothetical protein
MPMLSITVTSKTDPESVIHLEIPVEQSRDLRRVTNWRNRLDRECLCYEIAERLRQRSAPNAFNRWHAKIRNATPAYKNKVRGPQRIHTSSHYL